MTAANTPSTPFSTVTESIEPCDHNFNDPPPPYPSRKRRSRTSGRRHYAPLVHEFNGSQGLEQLDPDGGGEVGCRNSAGNSCAAATETTRLLTPPFPGHADSSTRTRQYSISHSSVKSVAPSLAQTVLSLFNTTDDDDNDMTHGQVVSLSNEERIHLLDPSLDIPRSEYEYEHPLHDSSCENRTRKGGFFTLGAWKNYFKPLKRMVYYRALFHLLVINFPYALAAWIYMILFTLLGTTLMMVLPLGPVLFFLDLLGARAFARGELALQSRFHNPLAYPPPYPPRPIFTRFRAPTASEVELGITTVPETSFYKNTYAMFTDAMSYQALFYFIVIKPSITLLLSLILLIAVVPGMILILPAPAALRATRRLGAWQANVAIEGLYLEVR